ncbi:MAG: type II secretion system F family protein [Anaerolineales bacterium]|jgi:tight adherence protein B|nr:type II secretion system F family protein [Chloroflexota bacterium]MBK6645754.1 type II secretion system F family protein [Anaerolineales bacterium]
MNWVIIGGGGVLIVLLVIGLIASLNSERNLVEERLSQYLEDDDQKEIDKEAQKYVITNWVSKRVEKTPIGGNIARELARADMKLKVAEYIVLIALSILFFGLVAWFLGNQHWISAVIGLVIGAIAPRFYLKSQQRKRLQKFSDQLPDMLNLMVNGLRAGYSTMQALEAISKELPPPINDEFRRVVQELQIGIPMETALDNLLRRIPSDDLDFVITAINVQREVGGNLSEILDNISFTIRERIRIKGEVRVMTAQVRTSGTVLSLIPFGLTLILWFLNPEYLMSITAKGNLCAGAIICVVLGLIFTGYFIMMRIADIEV